MYAKKVRTLPSTCCWIWNELLQLINLFPDFYTWDFTRDFRIFWLLSWTWEWAFTRVWNYTRVSTVIHYKFKFCLFKILVLFQYQPYFLHVWADYKRTSHFFCVCVYVLWSVVYWQIAKKPQTQKPHYLHNYQALVT